MSDYIRDEVSRWTTDGRQHTGQEEGFPSLHNTDNQHLPLNEQATTNKTWRPIYVGSFE